MSAPSYTVNTATPTSNNQTVSKINNTLYIGSTGPFDAVVLSYDGSVWQFAIYMNSDSKSPYFASKIYEQVTADPDPIGSYEMLVGGTRDPTAGTGSVTV